MMKKKLSLAFALLFCTVGLIGCHRDGVEDGGEISAPTAETKFRLSSGLPNYLKEVGSYLSPETEYNYDENGDHADRIEFRAITGMTTLWYKADPVTGQVSPICTAEGCAHSRDSGCRYISDQLCPVPGTESQYYTVLETYDGEQIKISVVLLDASANSAYTIYEKNGGAVTNIAILNLQMAGQNLYLEMENITHDPETAQSSRERMLIRLDMSGEVLKESIIPLSGENHFLYADQQHLFIDDWNSCSVIALDLNGENRRMVWEYGNNINKMSEIYYDDAEKMLYMGYSSFDDSHEGYILRIDSELKAEKLEMPSGQLLSFHFTDTYIYYTVYDPVRLGTDKSGDACIEPNGAKIWRTRRDNTAEGELIFDSEQRLFFSDYQVSGNYLYLNHKHLMDSGKNVWFQASHAVLRVNFMENTMKWLNFTEE